MNNPPAFPMAIPKEWEEYQPGMSLRDWLAGQALAGIASDPDVDMSIVDRADWSYRMADAMLKARGE
jgi:hypothetical protein